MKDSDILSGRLRAVGTAVKPDAWDRHPFQERPWIEPGRPGEPAGRPPCGPPTRASRRSPPHRSAGCRASRLRTRRPARHQRRERHSASRTFGGERHDPARLAAAEQPDSIVVDLRARSNCAHCPDRVGGQEVELPVVARAALTVRLADAALVVGEDGDPGPDESLDQRRPFEPEARVLPAPCTQTTAGWAP